MQLELNLLGAIGTDRKPRLRKVRLNGNNGATSQLAFEWLVHDDSQAYLAWLKERWEAPAVRYVADMAWHQALVSYWRWRGIDPLGD